MSSRISFSAAVTLVYTQINPQIYRLADENPQGGW